MSMDKYFPYEDDFYEGIFISQFACHKIWNYKNLYLGSLMQICHSIEAGEHYDVLIPLDSLPGRYWEEVDPSKTILDYFPIEDFNSLSITHLNYLIDKIMGYLNEGKKTALFCIGGHGRTGYIAACVLYKMGIKDPIEKLHKEYCKQAIESSIQIFSIIEYTLDMDLWKYYDVYKRKEEEIAIKMEKNRKKFIKTAIKTVAQKHKKSK